MQASQFVMFFLSHTEVFNITLQSGTGSIFSKNLLMIVLNSTDPSTPSTSEELFNLCHSCACNIIEHIFGVLKWQFCILVHPPEYDMAVQAHLPPALADIHIFIWIYNSDKIDDMSPADEIGDMLYQNEEATGGLACKLPRRAKKEQANVRRDEIARNMWDQYQNELWSRGLM